ncbi:MAG: hypothetical protein KIT58_00010 [Planctomycetota bacterium]|nr:hypothetical protein [Planctomycetota bacterium]
MADPGCTGVAASWCPRCGDCACPRDEEGWLTDAGLSDPSCPLHALGSPHAEGPCEHDTITRAPGGWRCLGCGTLLVVGGRTPLPEDEPLGREIGPGRRMHPWMCATCWEPKEPREGHARWCPIHPEGAARLEREQLGMFAPPEE